MGLRRVRFQGPPRPPSGRQGAGDEPNLRRARPGHRTAHPIGGRRHVAGRQPLRRGAVGLSQRGVPDGRHAQYRRRDGRRDRIRPGRSGAAGAAELDHRGDHPHAVGHLRRRRAGGGAGLSGPNVVGDARLHLGRLARQAWARLTATRYDARGSCWLLVFSAWDGTRTVSTYDAARGWLVNRSTTMGAAQLQSLTYSRGPTGRIEAVTGADAAESWLLDSYDTLDRLVRADNQGGDPLDEAYAYDLRRQHGARTAGVQVPTRTRRQGPGSVRPHAPVRIERCDAPPTTATAISSASGRRATASGRGEPSPVGRRVGVLRLRVRTGSGITKRDASRTSIFLGDDVEVRGGLTTAYDP